MPLVIFSQYISPFHFGKIVLFRSLVEIMLALYIILILQKPEYRPRRDLFFWAFLGFALAFTVATVASINTYVSFWGTLERMGGLYSFWHYFAFYVIASSVLRTKEEWITFLKITIFTGVLSAFYGFGQRTNISFFIGSGGRERIFGTIGNAALFAGYEILNVFLALVLGLWSNKRIERNLLLASAAVMTIAVFLTAVRGSILGLSLGLLVFAGLYFYQTHSRQSKKAFLILGIVAILFVSFSFLFRNSELVQNSRYLRRVTDFSPSSYTVQTRFWAWSAGLKGWKENAKTMLVGWGPENFNIPFSKYFNPKFFNGPGSETAFDRAHNMFVEVLVTMGLVGLIAYLFLFWIVLRSLWRLLKKPESRLMAAGFIGMTVAYVIHNFFIFDTSANFLVFFSILAFIAWMNQEEAKEILPAKKHGLSSGPLTVIAFIVCILAIFLVYRTNILASKANRATTRGIVSGWTNDFNGAMNYFKKAVDYSVPGKYEERNRMAQYLLDYSSESQLDKNFVAAVQLAIKEVQKNADENPLDYMPELYLSRLNIILGKDDPKSPYNDEALTHANKALSYSPTFVRTYYEIGQAYLNKKDYKNAIAAFQKAIDLNPDVGLSYWYIGAIRIQEGNPAEGLKMIEQAQAHGYLMTENDFLNLASFYIKSNDINRLVPIYEGLVKVAPNKAQYHASLAVAYARVNRIDEAVEQAHLAAQLDPSFEADAKSFVQQLGRQW